MEILCKAVLTANVSSREEYDEFVRTIEDRLGNVDVVSVEVGEIARVKLDVDDSDDSDDEQRLAEAIADVARIEQVTQVETLAE